MKNSNSILGKSLKLILIFTMLFLSLVIKPIQTNITDVEANKIVTKDIALGPIKNATSNNSGYVAPILNDGPNIMPNVNIPAAPTSSDVPIIHSRIVPISGCTSYTQVDSELSFKTALQDNSISCIEITKSITINFDSNYTNTIYYTLSRNLEIKGSGNTQQTITFIELPILDPTYTFLNITNGSKLSFRNLNFAFSTDNNFNYKFKLVSGVGDLTLVDVKIEVPSNKTLKDGSFISGSHVTIAGTQANHSLYFFRGKNMSFVSATDSITIIGSSITTISGNKTVPTSLLDSVLSLIDGLLGLILGLDRSEYISSSFTTSNVSGSIHIQSSTVSSYYAIDSIKQTGKNTTLAILDSNLNFLSINSNILASSTDSQNNTATVSIQNSNGTLAGINAIKLVPANSKVYICGPLSRSTINLNSAETSIDINGSDSKLIISNTNLSSKSEGQLFKGSYIEMSTSNVSSSTYKQASSSNNYYINSDVVKIINSSSLVLTFTNTVGFGIKGFTNNGSELIMSSSTYDYKNAPTSTEADSFINILSKFTAHNSNIKVTHSNENFASRFASLSGSLEIYGVSRFETIVSTSRNINSSNSFFVIKGPDTINVTVSGSSTTLHKLGPTALFTILKDTRVNVNVSNQAKIYMYMNSGLNVSGTLEMIIPPAFIVEDNGNLNLSLTDSSKLEITRTIIGSSSKDKNPIFNVKKLSNTSGGTFNLSMTQSTLLIDDNSSSTKPSSDVEDVSTLQLTNTNISGNSMLKYASNKVYGSILDFINFSSHQSAVRIEAPILACLDSNACTSSVKNKNRFFSSTLSSESNPAKFRITYNRSNPDFEYSLFSLRTSPNYEGNSTLTSADKRISLRSLANDANNVDLFIQADDVNIIGHTFTNNQLASGSAANMQLQPLLGCVYSHKCHAGFQIKGTNQTLTNGITNIEVNQLPDTQSLYSGFGHGFSNTNINTLSSFLSNKVISSMTFFDVKFTPLSIDYDKKTIEAQSVTTHHVHVDNIVGVINDLGNHVFNLNNMQLFDGSSIKFYQSHINFNLPSINENFTSYDRIQIKVFDLAIDGLFDYGTHQISTSQIVFDRKNEVILKVYNNLHPNGWILDMCVDTALDNSGVVKSNSFIYKKDNLVTQMIDGCTNLYRIAESNGTSGTIPHFTNNSGHFINWNTDEGLLIKINTLELNSVGKFEGNIRFILSSK